VPTTDEISADLEALKSDVRSLKSQVQALSVANGLAREQLIVTTYTKVIDVQMHFNEMVMRVRNLAVTLILAVFGAAAYSMQNPYFIHIFGEVHIAALIIAFGLAAWASLWVMDLWHFHLLLRGAVKFSTDIEDAYKDDALLGKILGMTKAISRSSRHWFGCEKLLGFKVTAAGKLHVFYAIVMLVGIVYFLVVWYSVKKEDFPPADRPQVMRLDPGNLTIHIDQPAVAVPPAPSQRAVKEGTQP
jgi:hypothetical protein